MINGPKEGHRMSGALAAVQSEQESAEQAAGRAVDRAVRAVARAILERTEGIRPLPAALVRRIRTRDATFRVHARLLGSPQGGEPGSQPAVLVVVERGAPEPPHEDEIRRTLGLTRQQAKVARLLAVGLTNTRIADELFISPHTARHHTESIMGKLGCRTRAQVTDAVFGSVSVDFEGNEPARDPD
jgi:DNA-binding NarL/FixJ family response regulator